MAPADARAALGPRAWLGVSCHDPSGLRRAADGGADYATLSPVFDSPNKGPALGIERFAAFARAAPLPVFALGGVQARHAEQLRAAGARGLAVISAVFGAADPAAAVRALLSPRQA
jgi:thiamine-phosphate pyrophosphorylase